MGCGRLVGNIEVAGGEGGVVGWGGVYGSSELVGEVGWGM